jgi:flagellar motor switch/type III secretory pathway protein FliN
MTSARFEANENWSELQEMKLPLAVRVPMKRMKLAQVRALQVGSVVESTWPVSEEVPLHAANVALSWCEFAVVDGEMAARVTRLG